MVSKSWSYFFWGVLVSLILGLSVRVFFSPERMRAWIVSLAEERQPKFSLDFEKAKLTLAPSFPPRLAVEFDDIQFAAKDKCVTNTRIKIDNMVLPVAWDILWSRRLNFHTVRLKQVKLIHLPPECSGQIAVPELDDSLQQVNEFQKIESYLASRWQREVSNTVRFLNRMTVESLQIFEQAESQYLMSFNEIDLRLDESNQAANINFRWSPGLKLSGFNVSGVSRFSLNINTQGMTLKGQGNVLEGRYDVSAEWDVDRSDMNIGFVVKDFPAPEIFQFVNHWKLSALPPLNIRNQWFQCEGGLNLSSRSPKDFVLTNKDCSFYGDFGSVKLQDHDAPISLQDIYPLAIQLNAFEMKALNPRVIEESLLFWRYSGQLDGRLTLLEPDQLFIKGRVNNMFLYLPLANESVWTEMFETADFEAKVRDEKVYFELQNIKPQDLEPIGRLHALRAFSAAQVIENNQVELGWDIDTRGQSWGRFNGLLNEAMGFQSKGEALLEQNKWSRLDADIRFESFDFRGTVVSDVHAKVSFKNSIGSLILDTGVIDGSDSSLPLFTQLKERLQDNVINSLDMNIRFEEALQWAVNPMAFEIGETDYEFVGRGFSWGLTESLLKIKTQDTAIYNLSGPVLDPSFEKPLNTEF